jgi:hypothetical protein
VEVCPWSVSIRHNDVLAAGELFHGDPGRTTECCASQFLLKGKEKLGPLLLVSILGLLFAVFWAIIAWNRVRIIEEWDRQVQNLDRHRVYVRVQEELKSLWKPTRMTRFVPWFLIIVVWPGLMIWAWVTQNTP